MASSHLVQQVVALRRVADLVLELVKPGREAAHARVQLLRDLSDARDITELRRLGEERRLLQHVIALLYLRLEERRERVR